MTGLEREPRLKLDRADVAMVLLALRAYRARPADLCAHTPEALAFSVERARRRTQLVHQLEAYLSRPAGGEYAEARRSRA